MYLWEETVITQVVSTKGKSIKFFKNCPIFIKTEVLALKVEWGKKESMLITGEQTKFIKLY